MSCWPKYVGESPMLTTLRLKARTSKWWQVVVSWRTTPPSALRANHCHVARLQLAAVTMEGYCSSVHHPQLPCNYTLRSL